MTRPGNFAVAAAVNLALLLFICSAVSESIRTEVTFTNLDGSKSPVISSEVVSTPLARNIGMMYRKELGDTAGMLFIFPDLSERSFWMKNTFLELDIIFFDDAMSVVAISERAVPHSLESRRSVRPARYVLEVLGGSSAKWGIKVGSKVLISPAVAVPAH